MKSLQLLKPAWPAPPQVKAAVSTRAGGVSGAPWASLNLGAHVDDQAAHVIENRRRFRAAAGLPREPAWLNQVHGTRIVDAGNKAAASDPVDADGAFSNQTGVVCAVLTADCLPVLFCDAGGSRVAAVHAGWRGLAHGVLEAAVEALEVAPAQLLAWLGPAIGPGAFEVGAEVREQFADHDPGAATAFVPSGERWLADIYQLARGRLAASGVLRIYGGGQCTVNDPRQFFSYRRDGQTGRMASAIWLEADLRQPSARGIGNEPGSG